jgi:hypothetical protein
MDPKFASQFFRARFGRPPRKASRKYRDYLGKKESRVMSLPGGHWDVFSQNKEATEKFMKFLVEKNFIETNNDI